jgi:anti-anti-sigma regulatory factor
LHVEDRKIGNGQVLLTLSGRIEEGEIQELQQLLALEKSGQQLILNLRDVTLVNQDAVKFLAQCEARGIKLENCPLHIRTWIDQVTGRPRRRQM